MHPLRSTVIVAAALSVLAAQSTGVPRIDGNAIALTIDIVDGRTRVLLWRGWAEGDIGHIIDNQRALDDQVGRAVARILERLPRGL